MISFKIYIQISFLNFNLERWFLIKKIAEAALQRSSQEKVFWKYAAILQENTHAEVHF